MGMKKKFSVSLPPDVLESLRTGAKKESMSVNGFICKTLENYSIWDLHNADLIPVRKTLLARFLEKFTMVEIDSIAKDMAMAESRNTVFRVEGSFNAHTAMKTFEAWLRMTGFPYSYNIEDTSHRFVVLHDLGLKWSLYLVKMVSATMVQFDIFPKYDYTDKILSITIDFAHFDEARKATESQIEILDAAVRESKKR